MGVRVQVLDLLMTTLVVWICWRYLVDPRRRWLVGLPLVAALWANLHAGWPLLFLIGGATLGGEALDRLLRRRLEPAPLTWAQLRDLGLALLAAGAALSLNPNGIGLYAYPFDTVGITALSRYVMEWFPATLDTLFGQLLAGFVVVGVLPTLIFGRRRLRTADALVLLGLTVLAFRAIRFLLLVGPIGGAIVAVALAPLIAETALGRRAAPTLARLSQPATGRRGSLHAAIAVHAACHGPHRGAGAHESRPADGRDRPRAPRRRGGVARRARAGDAHLQPIRVGRVHRAASAQPADLHGRPGRCLR